MKELEKWAKEGDSYIVVAFATLPDSAVYEAPACGSSSILAPFFCESGASSHVWLDETRTRLHVSPS